MFLDFQVFSLPLVRCLVSLSFFFFSLPFFPQESKLLAFDIPLKVQNDGWCFGTQLWQGTTWDPGKFWIGGQIGQCGVCPDIVLTLTCSLTGNCGTWDSFRTRGGFLLALMNTESGSQCYTYVFKWCLDSWVNVAKLSYVVLMAVVT